MRIITHISLIIKLNKSMTEIFPFVVCCLQNGGDENNFHQHLFSIILISYIFMFCNCTLHFSQKINMV